MHINYLGFIRSNFFLAFLVSTCCFVFTYLFFGFYFVEYEGLNISFFSGKLTPGFPFRSVYFSGNIGISYVYSMLYEHIPDIEWMSWIEYGYLFISCCFGLFILLSILPKGMNVGLKIVLIIPVYFFVYADNNIHLLYTRVAYMCCGISLLGLLVCFKNNFSIKNYFGKLILLNVFFTIGTLTRNESAIASFLLISIFGVFYFQSFKQLFVLFLYPFLLITSLSSLFYVDIKTAVSKEFYKQVEPDIEEQFIARGNRAPISHMLSKKDSIIYKAAEDIMWSDPKVLSAKYLRELILPERFMFTDAKQWARVVEGISDIFKKYWYLLALNLFLAIALYFIYDFKKVDVRFVLWIIFELSFFGLIVAQTYVDKLNDRSFIPLLGLFIFCHIFLLFNNTGQFSAKQYYSLAFFVGIIFFIHCYYLKTESDTLNNDLSKYRANYEKIKTLAHNKTLVLNSTSFDYIFLSNKPFSPFDFSVFKKIYITDGYIIPFLPYYKRYLESECNCDIYEFPSFWGYIRSIKQNVVIVSKPYRIHVVKDYLEELYNFKLPLKTENSIQLLEVQKSDSRDNPDDLMIYTLD